jgi:hypothetical protein
MNSDNLQSIAGEILEMSRHCRGMSASVHNCLFGPQLQENKKEANISCLADALKEVRCILSETLNTLELINRKL